MLLPWIAPLYPWTLPYIAECLSKAESSTIFRVFGMTRTGDWTPVLPDYWRTLCSLDRLIEICPFMCNNVFSRFRLLWRGMLPRGKGRPIKSTGPKDWQNQGQKEGQSYLHSMTYDRLDREGNAGHSSSMTGRKRRRKVKWLAKPFSTKMIPFRQRKFGKDSLVLRTEVGG